MSHWSLVMSHMTLITLALVLWKYPWISTEFLEKVSIVDIFSSPGSWPFFVCQCFCCVSVTRCLNSKAPIWDPKLPTFPPKKRHDYVNLCTMWRYINLQIIWFFRQLTLFFGAHALLRLANLFGGRFEKQQLLLFLSSEVLYDQFPISFGVYNRRYTCKLTIHFFCPSPNQWSFG